MPLKISALSQMLPRPDRRRPDDVGLRLDRHGPGLDADGLEMYDGFFTSLDAAYLDRVGEAIHAAGFAMPMLCCSPDFTNPDADAPQARRRARGRDDRASRGGSAARGPSAGCSQRPALSRGQPGSRGWNGSSSASSRSCPSAREHDIVLGLENHYKDGFWKYPEFAQKKDVFLDLLAAIPDRDALRRAVRPVQRHRRGRRPGRAASGRGRPRREHARQRPLPRRGHHARRPAPDRRHARLLAQPAARRDRQGAQRLRRHLPHPRRARLSRLGQHRGRHERHGRDGRVARLPAADDREVFPEEA